MISNVENDTKIVNTLVFFFFKIKLILLFFMSFFGE
jgi:hypothetical protein